MHGRGFALAEFAFEAAEQLLKGNIAVPPLEAFDSRYGTAAHAAVAMGFQETVRPIGEQMAMEKLRRVHGDSDHD